MVLSSRPGLGTFRAHHSLFTFLREHLQKSQKVKSACCPHRQRPVVLTSAQQRDSSCWKAELWVIDRAGGQEPSRVRFGSGEISASLLSDPVLSRQLLGLCPTLCDPVDCSPPGSSVHGVLQAGILEWVAMPLLQGILIFPTQGSNPGLLHWQADSLPSGPRGEPWAGGFTSLHLSLLMGTIAMTRPHPRHSRLL